MAAELNINQQNDVKPKYKRNINKWSLHISLSFIIAVLFWYRVNIGFILLNVLQKMAGQYNNGVSRHSNPD
jgi:hypothetical protein